MNNTNGYYRALARDLGPEAKAYAVAQLRWALRDLQAAAVEVPGACPLRGRAYRTRGLCGAKKRYAAAHREAHLQLARGLLDEALGILEAAPRGHGGKPS